MTNDADYTNPPTGNLARVIAARTRGPTELALDGHRESLAMCMEMISQANKAPKTKAALRLFSR